jgi:hypothetical protein
MEAIKRYHEDRKVPLKLCHLQIKHSRFGFVFRFVSYLFLLQISSNLKWTLLDNRVMWLTSATTVYKLKTKKRKDKKRNEKQIQNGCALSVSGKVLKELFGLRDIVL